MTEQDGIALVRRIIPSATEEEAGYILWNETGFPGFYHGDDPESCFSSQVKEYANAAQIQNEKR